MKRISLLFTTFTLSVVMLCVPVSAETIFATYTTSTAAAASETEWNSDLEDAKKYAYLDPQTASEKMKERILNARKTIIFSTNWVADGFEMTIEDLDGNVIKTVPKFSDVFPDWDLPTYDIESENISPNMIPAEDEQTPRFTPLMPQ